MRRSLQYQIQYMIQYYRRMNWILLPEDLIAMCAEDAHVADDGLAWNILMDARNYLLRQRYAQ